MTCPSDEKSPGGRGWAEIPGAACSGDPDVTVVLPVYRNRETLCELYRRINLTFKTEGTTCEIIFVDDACPDNSLSVLEELARYDPRVAVLSLGQNSCQHRAVMAGLRVARGGKVVVLDADLQDPPEVIPILLARLKEGYDAVFAGRRGRYEPVSRLLTSCLFKGLLHRLCGVPADAGMFVAMSRRMAGRLLAMEGPRPFVVAMIGCAGLPLASLPVTRSGRPGGRSAYSSWKRLKTGCLAIAWVLSCKWRKNRRFLRPGAPAAHVRATIGARFYQSAENPPGGEEALDPELRQRFQRHNRNQRRYFEDVQKDNMIPKQSRYLGRHVDELLRFAGLFPGERVLEVGCGMGRYTLILAEKGLKVEGLDLSPVLLDRLRVFDGGRYNIPLHCADVVDHPPELDGQFDAVVGFFTLHHLHDLTLCFEAIGRLVKPGGRVVFLEPNPYNVLYYVQILVTPSMTWQGDRGLVRMRPDVLFRAMGDGGLSRLAMYRFGFFPPCLADRSWGSRLEERWKGWPPGAPFCRSKSSGVSGYEQKSCLPAHLLGAFTRLDLLSQCGPQRQFGGRKLVFTSRAPRFIRGDPLP